MAIVPYYLIHQHRKSIVYNVLQMPYGGWSVQAFIPERTPSGDRQQVLAWFAAYRSQVRRENPFWIVTFRATDRIYRLDIKPTAKPLDVAAENEHVWRQLEFNYA